MIFLSKCYQINHKYNANNYLNLGSSKPKRQSYNVFSILEGQKRFIEGI
jgi:hypothetical protein